MSDVRISSIGNGAYLVEHALGREVVYAAGTEDDRWIFWNGRVFHRQARPVRRTARASAAALEHVVAPMPATVRSVLVEPGAVVKKGQPLVIVEAMKMELTLRAPADAVVSAVRCREGELVQGDAVLVEFAN